MRQTLIVVALACGLVACGCESLHPTTAERDRVADSDEESQRLLIMSEDDGDVGVALARSRMLAREKSGDVAAAYLDARLSRSSDSALLVERSRLTGDHAQAESFLRRAIALDEGHPTARVHLGTMLGRQGRWGEAVDELRRQVTTNPTLAEGHLQLALALAQVGDREGAIGHLLVAMNQMDGARRDPPWWAWRLLGDLYADDPRWGGAKVRFHARAVAPPGVIGEPYPPLPPAMRSLGVGLRPFDEAPALGIVFDLMGPEPRRVLWPARWSISGEAGVRRDDVIVGLDGREIHTIEDVKAWMDEASTEGVTVVEVERAGSRLGLETKARSGAWFEAEFEKMFVEAAAAFARKDYARSWDLYANMVASIGGYNDELVYSTIVSAVLAGQEARAAEHAEGWCATSPGDKDLLWLSAYALSSQAAKQTGADRLATYERAFGRIQEARRRDPGSGFLEAYVGVLEIASSRVLFDRPEADPKHTQEERIRSRLNRAMALGGGGWAADQLAAFLDGQENARRAVRREQLEQNRRAFASALLCAFVGAAAGGSGGSAFGSNPWRDYGYESQAIYGPSQPAFGPAYQIEQGMINAPWGY